MRFAPTPPRPRVAARRLEEAMEDAPVVLLQGPRQCGKSTLARMVGDARGYTYLTLDAPATLEAALQDPVAFVDALPPRVIVDEIQRAPQLFLPIKLAADRDRRPGRFVLTGSADVLLLPRLADSLAGRMAIVPLRPFAQCELQGTRPTFLDTLLDGRFELASGLSRLKDELVERVVGGGFAPALERAPGARRARWYRDYVESLVKRDLRDLARVHDVANVSRLATAAAVGTGQVLNVSALAGALGVARPTLTNHLQLLAMLFLVEELPPWHSNKYSRLTKSPKLHFCDSGVAAALAGADIDTWREDRTRFGALLETFVVAELRRLASGFEGALDFFHFRDRDQVEVDLVIESGRHVCAVEVKAGATVGASDFAGLRRLTDVVGSRFRCGVVLYDGEDLLPFGPRLWAVPLRRLWD